MTPGGLFRKHPALQTAADGLAVGYARRSQVMNQAYRIMQDNQMWAEMSAWEKVAVDPNARLAANIRDEDGNIRPGQEHMIVFEELVEKYNTETDVVTNLSEQFEHLQQAAELNKRGKQVVRDYLKDQYKYCMRYDLLTSVTVDEVE